MRANPTKRIEDCRVTSGPMASDSSYGANGAFRVPYREEPHCLLVIASDGSGWMASELSGEPWEHVSVSLPYRCPTWEEMDFVKRIFWRDDESVVQFHPPKSQHVNVHPYCLHMWRPTGFSIPLPPTITVGPLQANVN